MSVYKLEKIKRSYNEKVVFESVDLSFEPGKIYSLVGENGSGKTSLLEILALLEKPDAGTLSCCHKREDISFCMQQPHLFRTSAYNNLAFGLKVRQARDIDGKINNISQHFGLNNLLFKPAVTLSGGEAQRVALARTLILDTPVILLDEPTANLDEVSIGLLNIILEEKRNNDTTIILASHRLENAFRLADEVITLKDQQAYAQSYQNFFTGMIQETNGLKKLKINKQVDFIIATEKRGKVKVSIDPKEIIVSKEKFQSSARNCLAGKVLSIVDEGSIVKLTADCGIKLVSQITHKSLEELGINVGQQVYLTFKTSSVKIY